MLTRENFDIVIGMEFHVKVNSLTKLFSRAHMSFGDEINDHVAVVDAGMPGALPCVNKYCMEASIKTGLALNMTINNICQFDRKHYSYPDLPLKYQITQFYKPIAENGFLLINNKKIRLERISLEADAGKNIHTKDVTYVDLNRCGSPLMEIVTAPDLSSEEEAAELFKQIRRIVRHINTSNANMDKGELRADVNISINPKGAKEYGTRVEIKNINSMNFAKEALTYEINRHIDCINNNIPILRETRTFDPASKQTISMRVKESDEDYRYMPDPDLMPIITPSDIIEYIKQSLPELPSERINRWMNDFGLSAYEAEILIDETNTANYYDECSAILYKTDKSLPKQAATWILGDFAAFLNKTGESLETSKITSQMLSELILAIYNQTISGKQAKEVFKEMFETGNTASQIIKEKGLQQNNNLDEIEKIAKDVINAHPKEVEQVKSGKMNIFGFLVGQSMKASKGQANPEVLNKILKKMLNIE